MCSCAKRLKIVAAIAISAALWACSQPPDDLPADEVRQQLVGTWLRAYSEDGLKIRRVLQLRSDGQFEENSLTSRDGSSLLRNSHQGEWHFDGTNLKRRYRLIDGRQPSAPSFPYAAFQIRFETRNAFVGTDNVRKRELRYERVPEGTQP